MSDAIVGAGAVYVGRLEQKVQQRTSKLEERLANTVEENRRKDIRHVEEPFTHPPFARCATEQKLN